MGTLFFSLLAFMVYSVNTYGQPYVLQIHILISIVTFSILILAALQATLLQVQNRTLKNKSVGWAVQFLPSLQTMEKVLFQLLRLGFLFLTVSLITALFLLHSIDITTTLPKIIFSLAAWILFAILLYGRYQSGWRGFKATRLTLFGVLLLIVAYFGSKLMFLNDC